MPQKSNEEQKKPNHRNKISPDTNPKLSAQQEKSSTTTKLPELKQEHYQLLFKVLAHRHPEEPDQSINTLLVLSGRYDVNGNNVDKKAVENKSDGSDDLERILLAIDVAQTIAAKRAGVTKEALSFQDLLRHGPRIIYNGLDKNCNTGYRVNNVSQNDALMEWLIQQRFTAVSRAFYPSPKRFSAGQDSILKSEKLLLYPNQLFSILSLAPKRGHTKGQFDSLAQAYELGELISSYHPSLPSDKNNATVSSSSGNPIRLGLVSHQYHCPRIARLVSEGLLNDKIKVVQIFGADPSGKRHDYPDDIKSELNSLSDYTLEFGLPNVVNPSLITSAAFTSYESENKLTAEETIVLKELKVHFAHSVHRFSQRKPTHRHATNPLRAYDDFLANKTKSYLVVPSAKGSIDDSNVLYGGNYHRKRRRL